MHGIVLALLYAAAIVIFRSVEPEVAYLNSTNFLFWWYVVWTCILGGLILLVALAVTVGGAFVGGGMSNHRSIGTIVGMVLGGGFSAPLFMLFLARRAMYVGGAFLLSHALTQSSLSWRWSVPHIVLGGLLLLIALVIGARARAAASHSRTD